MYHPLLSHDAAARQARRRCTTNTPPQQQQQSPPRPPLTESHRAITTHRRQSTSIVHEIKPSSYIYALPQALAHATSSNTSLLASWIAWIAWIAWRGGNSPRSAVEYSTALSRCRSLRLRRFSSLFRCCLAAVAARRRCRWLACRFCCWSCWALSWCSASLEWRSLVRRGTSSTATRSSTLCATLVR